MLVFLSEKALVLYPQQVPIRAGEEAPGTEEARRLKHVVAEVRSRQMNIS